MYYYIINPAAGGGRINKIQEKLKERLSELGIAGEFEKSTGPADIPKLTKIAISKGFKTIVAVGGDGTINEVINSLDNKEGVALGIIPTGNTNELANLLGIHDWQSACAILAARKIEKVDLGKIDGNVFVTSASIGFDNVVYDLKRYQKSSPFSRGLYLASLTKAARNYKPFQIELEFDHKYSVNTECFNLSVSNGLLLDYLPAASKPQDNILDAILINKLSFRDMLLYGQKKINFNDRNSSRISVFHTQKVTIKTKNPVPVSADGQVVTQTPVTISISDKKLRVIVSRKRHF
ncbi:MAG: diacylglycerol kinase family protein [Patescibacteria group bacterium]